jgi:hypothetical protein
MCALYCFTTSGLATFVALFHRLHVSVPPIPMLLEAMTTGLFSSHLVSTTSPFWLINCSEVPLPFFSSPYPPKMVDF